MCAAKLDRRDTPPAPPFLNAVNRYILFAASTVTGEFLKTFKEFPPRQRAATFSIDQAVEKLKQNLGAD